jgi:hypothetical protein
MRLSAFPALPVFSYLDKPTQIVTQVWISNIAGIA